MAYTLQLGPLKFVTAVGPLTEQLGDALEVVGSSLVAGERKPRSFALKLPVRADVAEANRYAAGLRMRRQVRQLMENTAWRMQGLPFAWSIDPDLDCWLLVGGGDLTDPDNAGVTLGEWQLELTDCYVVGRPGTHRAGRRIDVADRRTGLVPRTSFGTIYSTDFAGTAPATYPATIPGDVADLWSTAGYVASSSGGVAGTSRIIYNGVPGLDGNVVTYEPKSSLPSPGTHAILDPPGQVILWDIGTPMTNGTVGIAPGTTDDSTRAVYGDRFPDVQYGWERVLGTSLRADRSYAMENSVCRVRWTGANADRLLLIEAVGSTGYEPVARVRSSGQELAWMVPLEVTGERAVVEYGTRSRRVRVILQRGWTGPRIEVARADVGGGALLSITLENAVSPTDVTESPSNVTALRSAGTPRLRAASSHAAVTYGVAAAKTWSAPEAFALQVSTGLSMLSATELAGLSLQDVRSVPVLVPR